MFPHTFEPSDVTVLLDPIVPEYLSAEERAQRIASGVHYNELISREAEPDAFYFDLFREQAVRLATPMAVLFETLANLVIDDCNARGVEPVLVSLVRAGTPTGVVLKRTLAHKGVEAPHYTVSIVQGKGFDVAAIKHILADGYRADQLIFVDGWTGKGVVRRELSQALKQLEPTCGKFHDALFVLSDIAGVAEFAATREDVLIPSALLSAPVSGLISRTLYRGESEQVFHGAAVLDYLAPYDLSRWFVEVMMEAVRALHSKSEAASASIKSFQAAQRDMVVFMTVLAYRTGISDAVRIKPGVGEASRLFLRKQPTCLIVKSLDNPDVAHLLALASKNGVPVEVWDDITLEACAIMP